MKAKIIPCVFFAVLNMLVMPATTADDLSVADPSRYAELEYSLFDPFFNALVDGDVEAIKAHLPDKEYARYERLLEKNMEYPEYLRKHYQGASFVLIEIDEQNSRLIGTVQIYWGDGRQTEMEFPLVENPRPSENGYVLK